MNSPGVPGLVDAPISKSLLLLSSILSSIAWIFNIQDYFILNASSLFSLQLWRLFTFHFIFQTIGETLFGLVLLYTMRNIERRMGSLKFASMLLSTSFVSFFFIICTLLFIGSQTILESPIYFSGPHSLIFSMIPIYFIYVPVYHRIQFLGIQLSDKVFTYYFCLNLLYNNFPSSLPNGLIGLISGIIYSYHPSGLSKFLIPKSIANFFKNHLEKFIVGPVNTPHHFSRRNNLNQRRFRNSNMERDYNQQQQQQQPRLSDQNINTLMEMGFTRNQSIEALTNSNDNLNEAINYLILNQ